jgi:hypothetical protein
MFRVIPEDDSGGAREIIRGMRKRAMKQAAVGGIT